MAHGQPDYWQSHVSLADIYHGEITKWSNSRFENVPAVSQVFNSIYTCPVGSRFYLGSIHVSCDKPGLYALKLKLEGGLDGSMLFDTALHIDLSMAGVYEMAATKDLWVGLSNPNLYAITARYWLSGYSESIE